MTRRARILGRVLLTEDQGRELAADAQIVLPENQFRAKCYGEARVGDFLWTQEPYHEWESSRWGPQNYFAIVAGPRFGTPEPNHIRNCQCKHYYRDGTCLPRVHSRATLEIIAADLQSRAIICRVHMRNVDEMFEIGRGKAAS